MTAVSRRMTPVASGAWATEAIVGAANQKNP
jgi:hypothetical protein